MTSRTMTIVFACALVSFPSVASAQRRVPAKDSGAVGGELGVFMPADAALDSGPTLEGFYEYYLSARNSVRMGLGWARPGFDAGDDSSLRYVRVALDVVHNWEGGKVHPFAGGGFGIYFLQRQVGGTSTGDSDTKPGVTLFGGVEYFTGRRVSIKGELRYHIVGNVNALNPDGAALSVGVKKYF